MDDVGAPRKLVQTVDDDMAPLTQRLALRPDAGHPHDRVVAGPPQAISQLLGEDLGPGPLGKQEVGYQNLHYRRFTFACMLDVDLHARESELPDQILIIAHPGHELRLFHWMEIHRPTVFVLTDGSGSDSVSRVDYTRRTLERAGAKAGAVFGQVSDRDWYAAIIQRDPGLLIDAAERIFRAASGDAPSLIITDPVEGYNPMHDLCAGVAAAVQAMITRRGGQAELGTYALTRPLTHGRCIERLDLDERARSRKRQAIAAYAPLSGEVATTLAHTPEAIGAEAVIAAPGLGSWPGALALPPEYETIGRGRVRDGRYENAIGYAGHVRPAFDRLVTFVEAHHVRAVGVRPAPEPSLGV